ncbi:MAG: hypothetical protein ACWGQW_23565, partial [bacterium]
NDSSRIRHLLLRTVSKEKQMDRESSWLERLRWLFTLLFLVVTTGFGTAIVLLAIGSHAEAKAIGSLITASLANGGLVAFTWKLLKQQQSFLQQQLASNSEQTSRAEVALGLHGMWWQLVRSSSQGSILSLFQIRARKDGLSVYMTGRSWAGNNSDPSTPNARWRSEAVELSFTEHKATLFYAWRGEHDDGFDGFNFAGAGLMEFERVKERVVVGTGWFTTTSESHPERTERKLAYYERVDEDDVRKLESPKQSRELLKNKLDSIRSGRNGRIRS